MPSPKELHEEAVCRRFLDTYNQANGTAYTFQGLQQPPAPDGLCSSGLNIEIVTAYYDQAAAKDQWDLALGNVQAPLASGLIAEPDQVGSDAIDSSITGKANKKYVYKGKLFLVVDIRAPLQEWVDIEDGYLNQPRNLQAGPFDEVWLLLGDADGDHVAPVIP
jgi:hypothetical protein